MAEICSGRIVHHEHILRGEQFFLDARRGDVDVVAMYDGGPAPGAGDPAEGVELGAELADEVGGVGGVRGDDEVVVVLVGVVSEAGYVL